MDDFGSLQAAYGGHPRGRWNWERTVAVLLLAPSVIAVAIFVYAFIAFTGYSSLSNWNTLVPDFSFVGFKNYQQLFAHPRFQIDMRNTFTFMILFLGGCLSVGFTLAMLLDQGIRGEGFFRGVYLFPMAVSFIVTGVAWRWLLNPGTVTGGEPAL